MHVCRSWLGGVPWVHTHNVLHFWVPGVSWYCFRLLGQSGNNLRLLLQAQMSPVLLDPRSMDGLVGRTIAKNVKGFNCFPSAATQMVFHVISFSSFYKEP